MIEIKCPNCKKTHRVPSNKISSPLARVRCSQCKHVFVIGPYGNRVNESKPDGMNIEKAKRTVPSVIEKKKEQISLKEDMSIQQAFQTLSVDAGASPDQVNESYVEASAVCLRLHNDSSDKNQVARRLYEINQAYEIAVAYIISRAPPKEEKPTETNQAPDVAPSYTTSGVPLQSGETAHNYTGASESLAVDIGIQGLFHATYGTFFNNINTFVPTIIKSCLLLFVTMYILNSVTQLIPEVAQFMPGYLRRLWITRGIVYTISLILMCIILTPNCVVACEYIVNKKEVRKNYLSLLLDRRCIKLFKCYVFIGLLFVTEIILCMIPFFILLYLYSEALVVMLLASIGTIIVLLGSGIVLGKCFLLFPYLAINHEEPIFYSFRNIERLPINSVLLFWVVGFPLGITDVICRLLQKYSDSLVLVVFLDFLRSMNYAVMACIAMISISLLYVRRPDNRQILTASKL